MRWQLVATAISSGPIAPAHTAVGRKLVAPVSSPVRHTRVLLGPHRPMRSAWPPDDHPTPYPPENLNGKVMLPDDPDHAALPDVPN